MPTKKTPDKKHREHVTKKRNEQTVKGRCPRCQQMVEYTFAAPATIKAQKGVSSVASSYSQKVACPKCGKTHAVEIKNPVDYSDD